MITSLQVNGFKSLEDFNIAFTKGLNVIIGPNGVGKTNICQAFNLLSSIPNNNVKETLYSLGGAAAVFSKQSTNKRVINIIAQGQINTSFKSKKVECFNLKYKYEINIKLMRNHRLDINENLFIERKIESDFIPIISVTHSGNKLRYEILSKEYIGDFQISEQKLSLRVDNGENLWGLMPRISFVCHAVGRDIFRIKSINIDPYIAREACDIVEPNRMASNGRYLANALYAISKDKELFDEINSIINDSLTCKGVIKPEISNILLKSFFTLVSEDGIKIPSNCLSDGTIKLLGLLVGIINQEHYTMIIEEPENYLHPRVDRVIIDFLRETFDEGVCILTSHSETILNLLNPRELIVCSNNNGKTVCKRLENAQRVLESIVDSGFGCGYHYVAGNLSEL